MFCILRGQPTNWRKALKFRSRFIRTWHGLVFHPNDQLCSYAVVFRWFVNIHWCIYELALGLGFGQQQEFN